MKRVLVIDDDPAVQRRCREFLEADGFEVSCEGSLVSARRFLRHSEADLVLLDLFLPDGCGYELFGRSQAILADRPVVGMTAVYLGTANARLIGARYPFAAVLSKPLDEASLLTALHDALGSTWSGASRRPAQTAPPPLQPPPPEVRDDAVSLDEELDAIDAILADNDKEHANDTPRSTFAAAPSPVTPSSAPGLDPSSSGGWSAPARRPEPRASSWSSRTTLLPRSASGRRSLQRTSSSLQRGDARSSSSALPSMGATGQSGDTGRVIQRAPSSPVRQRPSVIQRASAPLRRTPQPDAPAPSASSSSSLQAQAAAQAEASASSSSSLTTPLPPAPPPATPPAPSASSSSSMLPVAQPPPSQPQLAAVQEVDEDPIHLELDEISIDAPPPPAGVGGPDSLLGASPVVSRRLEAVPEPEPSPAQPAPAAQAPVPVVPAVMSPPHLDPSRFTYQGRIDETPVAVMLAHIARRGLTGSLLLRHDQIKKIIYIEQGVPRAIKSNLLSECLGRVMVRDGMITEEVCDASVVRLKQEGRLQGEILVEMGAVQPAQLEYMIERQFDLKIVDIFAWETGLYQFRLIEGERIDKVKQRVQPRNPFALVLNGVRASVTVERAARELSGFGNMAPVLLVPWNELQVMGLIEVEWGWMQLVDGRALAEIVTTSPQAPEAYRLFYALICAGLLAFQTSP